MIEDFQYRYNVVSFHALKSAGVSSVEISRARSCCLLRLSKGVYSVIARCSKPQHVCIRRLISDNEWIDYFAATNARDRARDHKFREHIARLAVVQYPKYRPADVVCEVSAALLHELPIFDLPLRPITVMHPRASSASSEIKRFRRPIPTEDCTEVHGVTVTHAVRAGLDLIGSAGPVAGLAALEHEVRRAVIEQTGDKKIGARNPRLMFKIGRELVESEFVPVALRLTRGQLRAQKILSIVSPLSEAYSESLCSYNLHQLGLHDFIQQWNVAHEGDLLTRLDFLFKEAMVVLVVDGVGKYVDAGFDRLRHENYQHNTLLTKGYRVIHFNFRDLLNLNVFAMKLFQQAPVLMKMQTQPLLR